MSCNENEMNLNFFPFSFKELNYTRTVFKLNFDYPNHTYDDTKMA